MININFTETDIKQLRYERFHHPHPRVQIKAEAVLLKSQELKHKEICKIAGISGNTLRGYLREYKEGGIEKLKEINFYKPESEFEKHRDTIERYFLENHVIICGFGRVGQKILDNLLLLEDSVLII